MTHNGLPTPDIYTSSEDTAGPASHRSRRRGMLGGSIALGVLLLVVAVIGLGSFGGGARVIHSGEATNVSLFSGTAALAAQKQVVGDVETCGQLLHSIKSVSYTTPPLVVHSVILGPALKAPGATIGTTAACLQGILSPGGFTVEQCPALASGSAGDTPDRVPAYIQALVSCVTAVEP